MEAKHGASGTEREDTMITLRLIGYHTSKSIKLSVSRKAALDMATAIVMTSDNVFVKLYESDDSAYTTIYKNDCRGGVDIFTVG